MAVKRSMEGFSLADCAYLSGFDDASHFNKTFAKDVWYLSIFCK